MENKNITEKIRSIVEKYRTYQIDFSTIQDKIKTPKFWYDLILSLAIFSLIISSLYYCREDINTFVIKYCNGITTYFYDLFGEHNVLFYISLFILFLLFIRELIKQYKNRNTSILRIGILLTLIYALSYNKELHWKYFVGNGIKLDYFLIIFSYASLTIESFKYLRSCIKIKANPKEEKFSLMSTPKDMIDIKSDKYISALVQNIKKIDVSSESFAIGITGSWGAGKTTFIKLLNQELDKQVKKSIIIQFNPWKSSNKDNIIKDFFATLQQSLSPYYSDFKYILADYCNLLVENSDNSTLSKLNKFIQSSSSKSLDSLQDQIDNILSNINYTIYISIDDIDRLDKDELLEVLKLIRNSASFKHVIYLVAYDYHYLAQSLRTKGIASPEIYIKKIFPLELSLPSFENSILPTLLKRELLRLLENIPENQNILRGLQRELLLRDNKTKTFVLLNYLKTFRDVRNFAISLTSNLLSYCHPINYIDDIYVPDFFWIELIRFINYPLYKEIKDEPTNFLTMKGPSSTSGIEETIFIFNGNLEKNKQDIKELKILQQLFSDSTPNSSNSIKYRLNFRKYFSYRPTIGSLSNKEFNSKILSSDDDIIKWMDNKFKDNTYHHAFLLKLNSYDTKSLSKENLERYIHFSCIWLSYNLALPKYLFNAFTIKRFKKNCKDTINTEFLNYMRRDIDTYSKDQCLIIAEQLQNMFSYTEYYGDESSNCNETIITNDHIADLITYNFEKFKKQTSFNVKDLLEPRSNLRKIIIHGVVLVSIDAENVDYEKNPTCYYKNLLLPNLIKCFENNKAVNDYTPFIEKFKPKFEDWFFEDEMQVEIKRNHRCIEDLFGNVEDYKDFLNKCFSIPLEEMENYIKDAHL